jgi:hypothetical protein
MDLLVVQVVVLLSHHLVVVLQIKQQLTPQIIRLCLLVLLVLTATQMPGFIMVVEAVVLVVLETIPLHAEVPVVLQKILYLMLHFLPQMHMKVQECLPPGALPLDHLVNLHKVEQVLHIHQTLVKPLDMLVKVVEVVLLQQLRLLREVVLTTQDLVAAVVPVEVEF